MPITDHENGSGTDRTSTRIADVSSSASAKPAFELVELDRYAVFHDGLVGYVDVVHPVFVCYLGHPFPQAVEIAQRHDFPHAVRAVVETASAAQARPGRAA